MFTIEVALAVWICRDAANVTTYRLYLNTRADAAHSNAVERFDVEGSRVVPQVAVRDSHDRIEFPSGGGWPGTIRVEVRPAERARYELRWHDADSELVLARGESATPAEIAVAIPARRGSVDLINDGALAWIDPRIVTDLRVIKRAVALAMLIAVSIALWRRGPRRAPDRASRLAVYRLSAAAGGAAIALLGLEAGLRALGNRAPPPILLERHDLGEVRRDPRWEYTPRYGRRLRPLVSDVSEWRYGDIVRMGFVPAAASEGVVHHFAFQTDAEGFRNDRTRERIDVAALGDSFTDAMTLDNANAWPRLLERNTGLMVQNYGTAGFGPQQELRVLTDVALAHHPRVVVLAYFAGNDIFDAEAFDEYERSGGTVRRPDPGWPIRNVVSRADTWFVVSAWKAVRRWASNGARVEASAASPVRVPPAADPHAPAFDRGMFSIPVNGRPLRWAFMPPYLNTLRMSRQDLTARTGWPLTKRAIGAMRDVSRDAGAELVVMFLPMKSQIYLPIVASALPQADVVRALRYSLPDGDIDVAAMLKNRRAQNDMLRAFCLDSGIRFVDMTDVLEARVQKGENVYFPDESHLNESGHAIVAAELAAFLRVRAP